MQGKISPIVTQRGGRTRTPEASPCESIWRRFARFAPRRGRRKARGSHFAQNFFRVVNPAATASSRLQWRTRSQIDACVVTAALQQDKAKKCTFHGHFCAAVVFCWGVSSARKFFAAAFSA
jgi:hypothetical protein